MTRYLFISNFDEWEADIMELNDSKYIEIEISKTYHIIIFYNAANHRIFIKLQTSKTADETLKSFELFKNYVNENFNDQFIEKIITDEGGEFNKLNYEDITHIVINS